MSSSALENEFSAKNVWRQSWQTHQQVLLVTFR